MLDRRRDYGEVMGEGVAGARWYQDGHYFAPDGSYLFSNPGVEAPKGEISRTMEQAEAAYKAAQAAQERGEAPPPKVSPAAKAVAKAAQKAPPAPGPLVQPQAPTLPEGATREQQLMQLNHFQLASLVKAANGTPITGAGSKAKNIAWLLANTIE